VRGLPITGMVARRVCDVGEGKRGGELVLGETNRPAKQHKERPWPTGVCRQAPGMVQWLVAQQQLYTTYYIATYLVVCVLCDAEMQPHGESRTKKKNREKKYPHRPRNALAGVEAKSTLGPRRNRGTCTLEQDDMHAASDHGRRPTTRIQAVCPLEERKAVSLLDSW
jgi:hypothetical protein